MTVLTKLRQAIQLVAIASVVACSSDGDNDVVATDNETTGQVTSALSTTSVTFAGDELRTGWYSDEAALAPSVVGGSSFGQLFATSISGQVYAQPLVSNGTLF